MTTMITQTYKTSVILPIKVDKHLTNVAINMNAPTYVKRIGGKWFLDNLKNFMLSKYKRLYVDLGWKRLTKLFLIFKDA